MRHAVAQFASDLDVATKNLLARGARLTELLKQPQYRPMPVEEQVVAIFAGVRGYLDKLDLKEISEFEQSAIKALKVNYPEYLEEIAEKKVISEELDKKLTEFYENFLSEFKKTEEAA